MLWKIGSMSVMALFSVLAVYVQPASGFTSAIGTKNYIQFPYQSLKMAKSTVEDLQDVLIARRTINDFAPELPRNWEESLERAIRAATYAPNHKRTEPWRFHLLGDKSIRNVCELNAKLVTDKKGEAAGNKKLDRWLAMPGWLVVTCQTSYSDETSVNESKSRLKRWLSKLFGRKNKEDGEAAPLSMDDPSGVAREDYAACCCAVQNLCLSLHADGIGTKWTTGPVNFDPGFAEAVGMPTNEYVVGTIWFGAPSKIPKPPPKRLSIDDIFTKHK